MALGSRGGSMQVRNIFLSRRCVTHLCKITQVQDRQQRGVGDQRRALSDISQYRAGQDTGELYTAMGPGGIHDFLCLEYIVEMK